MSFTRKSISTLALCSLALTTPLIAKPAATSKSSKSSKSSAPAEAPATAQSGTKALIQRFAKAQASSFTLESIPATNGCDTYEIESSGNKIILRGNSGVAQASAFYHYLKEFCHCHVSWNGDQLNLPATLPTVPSKIHVVSPVKHRLAYNYCTHGYSMAFWGKKQWERELDWLALHGINLALIIEGQDAVWQNTFTQFGYTKEEMRLWLCSPVHQPWQFMQNMQGVLPPPQSIVDQRAELGKWIVQRCRELGIQPLLQGYYGMLPSGFAKKFPNATIAPQGGWAGNNQRPDMLNPSDPLFAKIADTFHAEQKKIFGDCLFFAADPFHEGGSSKGMDRGTVYKQVQDAILKFEPRATLVKQCWQASNKEMFDAGSKEHSLALDLFCDCKPFWQKADSYSDTPWAWSFLYNFGGNLALEGNPAKLAANVGAAFSNPNKKRLEATCIVPEGSNTNPLMYELMTEMAWRNAPADINAWVNQYLHARYGQKNPKAEAAWATILKTAYSCPPSEGPINSVITAKPSTNKNLKGRTWAPSSKVPYKNSELAQAWSTLLEAAPELCKTDTYRYDLADVSRQVLTNFARPVFEKCLEAIQKKDAAELKTHSSTFLNLLKDIDSLTATRQDWLMGAWINDARQWGSSNDDQNYMELCSRMLLTTWIENPNTNLSDYANREWNGLVGEYYYGRWNLFFDAQIKAIEDPTTSPKTYDKDRSTFESNWVRSTNHQMPSSPVGDTIKVSQNLLEKYSPIFKSYDPSF